MRTLCTSKIEQHGVSKSKSDRMVVLECLQNAIACASPNASVPDGKSLNHALSCLTVIASSTEAIIYRW